MAIINCSSQPVITRTKSRNLNGVKMSVIRFILNRKCPGGFPGHFLSAPGVRYNGPKNTPVCVILQNTLVVRRRNI